MTHHNTDSNILRFAFVRDGEHFTVLFKQRHCNGEHLTFEVLYGFLCPAPDTWQRRTLGNQIGDLFIHERIRYKV